MLKLAPQGFTAHQGQWYIGAVAAAGPCINMGHPLPTPPPITGPRPMGGGASPTYALGDRVAPQDTTLEDLMERYAQGDEAAFAQLHRKVSGRLYGFFMRGGCSPQLARDLSQQTFLRIHVARGRYRIGAPVLPWLFTIAYRVRVDEQRRRGRRPESQMGPEEEQRLKAPQAEEVSDRVLALRQAINTLPDGQRQVVVLHKFEGLSMAEVAEVVGSTESAVKVRAHRAYKALKKVLQSTQEDQP